MNIPVDKTISQFVRWGKWKAVVRSNGNIELYNIHETFGISEHNEVAGEHPEIVASIRTYLADNDTKHRHVLIPD